MSTPTNFWLLIGIAILDLIAGGAMAIFVGFNHSWLYAGLLGAGFFISANILFVTAWQKLK